MPQLDFTTYPSQLFWLFVCFIVLYFILSYIATPKITKVIENRAGVLQKLSEKSHIHRDKAEELLAEYESTLQQARNEARERYKAMADQVNIDFTKRQKEIIEKVTEKMRRAEQELHQAKVAAQKDLHGISLGVAQTILAKVANLELSQGELQKRISKAGK
ncbi:ATP synthase F0 complex subunit b' [Candidatus Bealeia paramacronuclearis]|uniref:ATP synthase F0 complex subunit b n=1 Tax=Candidatus Bealeia paramacronuclearis TaxID=1921001 RepID=A0ABZ2C5C0_9PROT|nr:ATP synthase F0 complex subunit b' [Candidatus Bealeia paramacronuclearis]